MNYNAVADYFQHCQHHSASATDNNTSVIIADIGNFDISFDILSDNASD